MIKHAGCPRDALVQEMPLKFDEAVVVHLIPVAPALGRLEQKDCEFKASLGYIEKRRLKTHTHTEFLGEMYLEPSK